MVSHSSWYFPIGLFDHPLLVAWSRTKNQSDRREGLPLQLYLLVQWERPILQSSASTMEKIFLGAMLLQAWAGLRSAALQRISFETLVVTPDEVRGICWKTKTTHCGQPLGAICSCFLPVGSSNWLLVFLKTWDECFSSIDNVTQIDYIVPMMDDRGFSIPLQPMSYPRAFSLFRYYIKLPWKTSSPLGKLNPANYTLHGIKATLLSWPSQLRHQGVVTMEMCRIQGHRKPIQQSVSLYSREDVLGQLELQRRLVTEIHWGFRPFTPQHRHQRRTAHGDRAFQKRLGALQVATATFLRNETQTGRCFGGILDSDDDQSSSSSSSGSSKSESDEENLPSKTSDSQSKSVL